MVARGSQRISEIRRIYEGKSGKALLDFLAEKKPRGEVFMRKLSSDLKRSGNTVLHPDLTKLIKKLHQLEVVRFIVGRRGQESRFRLTVEPVSLVQMARGEREEYKPLDTEGSAKEAGDDNAELLKHSYRLRPNLILGFELPSNLTLKEAEKLAGFIKTLPYDLYED